MVGLCCSDALEKTNYGDVADTSLWEIWQNSKYVKLRFLIGRDRGDYHFCKGCDFFDAGIRNTFIKSKLNG